MRKITASKIIGFKISYNDTEGFVLSAVLEDQELPERSCTTIFVPYDGNAREINWEYDCGSLEYIGVEAEPCGKCRECEEEKKLCAKHGPDP